MLLVVAELLPVRAAQSQTPRTTSWIPKPRVLESMCAKSLETMFASVLLHATRRPFPPLETLAVCRVFSEHIEQPATRRLFNTLWVGLIRPATRALVEPNVAAEPVSHDRPVWSTSIDDLNLPVAPNTLRGEPYPRQPCRPSLQNMAYGKTLTQARLPEPRSPCQPHK